MDAYKMIESKNLKGLIVKWAILFLGDLYSL